MNEDFYISLIYKKLTGEILTDEAVKLEEWLNKSEDNQITAQAIQLAWDESPNTSILPEVDLDAAFLELDKKIAEEESAEKKQVPTKKLDSLADAPSTRKLFPMWGRIAAGLLILFVIGLFLRSQFQPKEDVLHWQTIVTQEEPKVLTLPDSSIVSLNPHSSLSFANKFEGEERLVTLQGEAFFEVKRNEEKPFKIDASEITIEVLGTSFSVRAYNDESKHYVHVAEGKVAVRSKNIAQTLILQKDEKGVLDKEANKVKKVASADPNELAWGTRTLVFNDVKLEEAFEVFEKFYDVRFEYAASQLINCRLSAVYSDRELKEILEGISALTDISFSESSPNIYQLKGGPCD